MIYFLQESSGNFNIKIGYAKNDAEARRDTIQPGNSSPLIIHLIVEGDRKEESRLHRLFAAYEVRREWFRPAPELLHYINQQASVKSAMQLMEKLRAKPIQPSWPLNIYLAGKISQNDWRKSIVVGLAVFDRHSDHDESALVNEEWPVLNAAIFGTHNYTGPYFISTDEGSTTSRFVAGDGDHGVGLSRMDVEVSGSHRPHNDIVCRCRESIDRSDVLFAWIDQLDCYGTITEIGYALGRGKMVWIAGSRMFRDMWFIYETASWSMPECNFGPKEALIEALEDYRERCFP